MRRSSKGCCWAEALLLTWCAGVASAATLLPESPPALSRSKVVDLSSLWQARALPLELTFLPDIRRRLRLDMTGRTDETLRLQPLEEPNLLRFSAPQGALDQVVDGRIALAGPISVRIRGREYDIEQPSLVPGPDARSAFRLLDGAGRWWLELRNAHDRTDLDTGVLHFFNMGVVAGPHLAELLGDARAVGTLVAVARMDAQIVKRPDRALEPSSCSNPNWPTPADPGDVALTGLGGYQMMRGLQADGPGGADGQVVVAPSAVLKNVGTRDMPWYGKFTGSFPPYGNDQHPFLVWSLYRMDPDGSLVQHARSGIKHAFLTINTDCTDGSCPPGNILGLGCEDVYDAVTNDVPINGDCPGVESCTLGPRRELVPRTGIWGRCGSIYDQNCDGNPIDTQAYGPFDHRMVAFETEFDPALHAGSLQWFEAWYIVRDDGNLFNSMGSTRTVPLWMPGNAMWNFNNGLTLIQNGPVIDRWLEAAPLPAASLGTLIDSPEGRAKLGVRVRTLGPGRWRYDYALANFDFARAVITGSNPDFTVVRAPGFDRLTLMGAAPVDSPSFRDGDREPNNQWQLSQAGGHVQWQAPTGAHLAWGTLYSFSFESSAPPVPGTAVIGIAEPGSPSQLSVATLVPETPLFRNGFEAP